jgi:NAD(P)-dependent dehydrogenase (short-subunit alcohol dehydrogenase family)
MTGHRNRSYVVTGAASGTGRATTSYLRAVNFFGAVATLNGLLPLLSRSPAPRAVAISSIAALNAAKKEIVEACLRMDEAAAHGVATAAFTAGALATADRSPIPEATRAAVVLYASAKLALERWCRESALAPAWAGRGIPLNAVALGVFDTPAAANLLEHAETRAALRRLMPLASAYPGRPEEAAALLAFSAGAENTHMTGGQEVLVDRIRENSRDSEGRCLARRARDDGGDEQGRRSPARGTLQRRATASLRPARRRLLRHRVRSHGEAAFLQGGHRR